MSYYRTQPTLCKTVTPAEALKLLEINTFEGQRKIDPQTYNSYARKMAAGTMRPVDIDIATGPDKIKVLMNGQHVCTAITVYGKPFDARIQYWKCDTYSDMWHLFGTFDGHRRRTSGQVIKGARVFLDGMEDLPISVLKTCSSALYMVSTDPVNFNGMGKCDSTTSVDILTQHKDDVFFINELHQLAGKDRRPIFRVPAVAAMIQTYRIDKEACMTFWGGVVTGAMLQKGSPQYKLANVLMYGVTAKTTIGGCSRARILYTNAIAYWNSWRKGGQRNGVKINSMKSTPAAI